MDKHELRFYFKEFLQQNYSKIKSQEPLVIDKIVKLINRLQVKTIGLYYPLKYEFDLLRLISIKPNLAFFLPKIIEDEIHYCKYHMGDELVLSRLNIYEPITKEYTVPEFIIVPGLAFSSNGYRLGRGQGFFDRYLSRNARNLFSAGVCLSEQIYDKLPVTFNDQKLNWVLDQ